MSEMLLRTKLLVPLTRPNLVVRPRLIELLDEGLLAGRKLTLVSAPAGFGKTTLVSLWAQRLRADESNDIAWLSLDESENEEKRFLEYVVTAVSQAANSDHIMGKNALALLQSPQAPAISVLTSLINDVAGQQHSIVLVLDDYHLIDEPAVDEALIFLLDHSPPQLNIVVVTRVDPQLPLGRLRAHSELIELRASDLRFTSAEAAEFLNQGMGLNLSAADIATLETRTEGWIAGLQLAALALQGLVSMAGPADTARHVQSFTGSHRFVLDYLIEEVLAQQPEAVQAFLLKTAVLERLTGPLCDAVTGQKNGQATLEMLEHTNLFIVPLDDERRWYRYH
ncbi:MAG: AAA family ATPase, partial [Anaerolineales bacterium]|nr:AAA family ATPase [Anaerolineales bacterium]